MSKRAGIRGEILPRGCRGSFRRNQRDERSPGQVLPLGSELLHDVLWQFECNLHGSAFNLMISGTVAFHYLAPFNRRRDRRNKAYNRNSSRSASSRPAVGLRRASVLALGPTSGKRVRWAPRVKRQSLKIGNGGLADRRFHRETVFAIVPNAYAKSSWLTPRPQTDRISRPA